jgi:hypothetical protein
VKKGTLRMRQTGVRCRKTDRTQRSKCCEPSRPPNGAGHAVLIRQILLETLPRTEEALRCRCVMDTCRGVGLRTYFISVAQIE